MQNNPIKIADDSFWNQMVVFIFVTNMFIMKHLMYNMFNDCSITFFESVCVKILIMSVIVFAGR